jgi:acetyl-CoA C-acetyltransferase
MIRSIRRVAILGGNRIRIPFARAGGPYAGISNQRMLGAALDGLIDGFSLVGEFAAGAVLKHARDFNLAREVVLGSRLDHRTPAYDVQQACATGMEAIALTANKIALGAMRTCGQARRPPGWPG